MQAREAPSTAARVTRYEQRFEPRGRFWNGVGLNWYLVIPQPVEQSEGHARKLSRDSDVGVALSPLAGKLARVQSANVEAPEKRFPAIHNEEFTVISPNVLQRVKPAKGVKPLEAYPGEFELAANGSEGREVGPESIQVQADTDAGAVLGGEGGGKTPAHLVGSEDVRFHSDVTLGAFDGADHGVVEIIPLGKELEGAMSFVERWHANPCVVACDVRLRLRGAEFAIALPIRRGRPTVPVHHPVRPLKGSSSRIGKTASGQS